MNKKKSLKQEMRKEFANILPNVLQAVVNTPVTKETTQSDNLIFQKLNFRMAFSALLLIFGFTIAGGGGYSYLKPNTYLTLSFTPAQFNTVLNLSSTTDEIVSAKDDIVLTLGVNQFDFVVEYDASDASVINSINEMGLKNKSISVVLTDIIDYAEEQGIIDLANNRGNISVNILTNYENEREKISSYVYSVCNEQGYNHSSFFMPKQREWPEIYQLKPNINPGKALAIDEILELTDQYTIEELVEKSNCEIAKILVKLRK